MAEEGLPDSGEELPRLRREKETEPPPPETMARPGTSQELPAPQLDPPVSATLPTLSTLTITENRPTTKISVSGGSVKVSTEYRGKQLSPEPTDKTRGMLLKLFPSKKPVTRQSKTPSMSSRETAKELHQTKEDLFEIDQLPKEKINLKSLPILYHVNYNLKLMGTIKVSYPFMLVNKPAKIFALLKEMLFEKHNCDCIEVEVTDFRFYSDDSYSVIPDAVKKRDIVEVTKTLKVRYSELPSWSVFDSAMLYPLRLQVNGSLQACGVAMKMGWAIHIGGGFGYNSSTFSKGLAVYDDILHCLLTLSESVPGHDIKHILIINYEARQSPNYEHIREIKFPVTILDFYLEKIPESEKDLSHYDNELVSYNPIKIEGNNAVAHLETAQRKIESFITTTETLPSLCIYIAVRKVNGNSVGTDIVDHSGEPSFEQDHAVQRDLDVFKTVQIEKHIPIAIIMGGGIEEIDVMAAAASITELCKIGWKRLNPAYVVNKS